MVDLLIVILFPQKSQSQQKLYIDKHIYGHIGARMGARKVVLTDSPDEPPGLPMQDSRAW